MQRQIKSITVFRKNHLFLAWIQTEKLYIPAELNPSLLSFNKPPFPSHKH